MNINNPTLYQIYIKPQAESFALNNAAKCEKYVSQAVIWVRDSAACSFKTVSFVYQGDGRQNITEMLLFTSDINAI